MVFESLEPIEALMQEGAIDAIERQIAGAQKVRAHPPFVRSALMLSAHRLGHLNKLDRLEADMVVLNLEDGVAPPLKPMALRLVGLFLSHLSSIRCRTVVRINPLGEGGEEEIAFLNAIMPDAIRIPKVKGVDEVEKALLLIDKRIAVHLSIETSEAWRMLDALGFDPRIEAWYLGVLDLFASMGLSQRLITLENPTMQHLLARFLLSASGLGVLPVSFVYQEYRNLETFRAWCLLEKEMGLHAKGCLSPRQVAIANEVFTPEPEAIERAKRVVALFESDPNSSGFVDEVLGFVDEPIYKDAQAILRLFGHDQ